MEKIYTDEFKAFVLHINDIEKMYPTDLIELYNKYRTSHVISNIVYNKHINRTIAYVSDRIRLYEISLTILRHPLFPYGTYEKECEMLSAINKLLTLL
jgi:hypothetical protein